MVEYDSRWLMGFLTLVVAIMYFVSLFSTPALRQPLNLAAFTALILVHIFLHWKLEAISKHRFGILSYILIQGVLAFAIAWMSGTVGMVFALFMGLIGEGFGLLGLTWRGFLAIIYYLLLSLIIFIHFTGAQNAIWWALGTLPIVLFVGIYVILYMRQTEAREHAQTLAGELETANRQLTEYAARVEDLTIANERQRMARELHDTLSQGLAGLILQLEAADAHLSQQHPEKAAAIVQQAMQRARATLADSRRAISDLRQSSTDELAETLRLKAVHFTESAGIPCAFEASPLPLMPDAVKEVVLRSTSELLTNIARHANATKASLKVFATPTHLKLSLHDNGVGFDPQKIPAGHYGLLGVRERVHMAGGELTLDSTPQQGTIIQIELPLQPAVLESA